MRNGASKVFIPLSHILPCARNFSRNRPLLRQSFGNRTTQPTESKQPIWSNTLVIKWKGCLSMRLRRSTIMNLGQRRQLFTNSSGSHRRHASKTTRNANNRKSMIRSSHLRKQENGWLRTMFRMKMRRWPRSF